MIKNVGDFQKNWRRRGENIFLGGIFGKEGGSWKEKKTPDGDRLFYLSQYQNKKMLKNKRTKNICCIYYHKNILFGKPSSP